MPRIRTVKPEFWQNEELASLSAEACLLAIGLLNIADDDGWFRLNAKLIESQVFPLRDLSVTVTVQLQELANIGYITLHAGSDGKEYGQIVKFRKHQYIQKPKPSAIAGLIDNSDTGMVQVQDGYRGERKGKEGKGGEGNTSTATEKTIDEKQMAEVEALAFEINMPFHQVMSWHRAGASWDELAGHMRDFKSQGLDGKPAGWLYARLFPDKHTPKPKQDGKVVGEQGQDKGGMGQERWAELERGIAERNKGKE